MTAELRSHQNIENVAVSVGTDELDVSAGVVLKLMLFELDLVSDNFHDAVVIGDLFGVGHAKHFSAAQKWRQPKSGSAGC